MVINGERGTVAVLMYWTAISQLYAAGAKSVRRLATGLYSKAFGHCEPVSSDSHTSVECKSRGSQHIGAMFSPARESGRTRLNAS